MYQLINKKTNLVVAEALAYAPLEAEDGRLYFVRNADTGVEWDIPEHDEIDPLSLAALKGEA